MLYVQKYPNIYKYAAMEADVWHADTWRAVAGGVALRLGQVVVAVPSAAPEGETLTLLRGGVVMPAREGAAARPHLLWSHAVIWWET